MKEPTKLELLIWKIQNFFLDRWGCKVGYHRWTWNLRDTPNGIIGDEIPDFAKCDGCGITYKP